MSAEWKRVSEGFENMEFSTLRGGNRWKTHCHASSSPFWFYILQL